jgi:hypothetical protein
MKTGSALLSSVQQPRLANEVFWYLVKLESPERHIYTWSTRVLLKVCGYGRLKEWLLGLKFNLEIIWSRGSCNQRILGENLRRSEPEWGNNYIFLSLTSTLDIPCLFQMGTTMPRNFCYNQDFDTIEVKDVYISCYNMADNSRYHLCSSLLCNYDSY